VPIFEELSTVVHRLPGIRPEEIASGLAELLDAPERLTATVDAQEVWLAERSWPTVARGVADILHGAMRETP